MSSGGGGGSGTQKYEWNDYLKKPWADAIEYAGALKDKPYNPYPYQRIADQNSDQQASMDVIRKVTDQGGLPVTQAANQQLTDTLQGNYLDSNPYASQSNPYMGYSPYFRGQVDQELGDITNAYKQGTSADTTRMFNMAGAFGGSAHQNAVANNEAVLGKTLSNAANQAYGNQWNQSAGLYEQGLNRGAGAFENERGRMQQAVQGGQNAQNLFFQGANQRMGIGDINRGYEQDLLNQYYNDFQQQQNYPASQLDYYTGILGRAQGGISPNMTTSQSGYSASPYSQVLGAGLLAYGMR